MKIVFTGVVLRSVQRDSTSGKLHFSAELTAADSKAFDWGALPDTAIGCKMDGELSGGSLVLTPKEMGLRPSELACDFATLGHFEVLRLETENSRGKGHRSEVRFVVKFGGKDVAGKAEGWLVKIGEGKGSLSVNYEKQATLPGVEDDAETEEA